MTLIAMECVLYVLNDSWHSLTQTSYIDTSGYKKRSNDPCLMANHSTVLSVHIYMYQLLLLLCTFIL